jgi:translation initiation factor 2 subunit 3
MALEIMGVKNIVIVQNKIDLVTDERARENYQEIKRFVKGTIAENAPIIPVSAHHDANIDILIEAIEETIPTPSFDKNKNPRMYIARSFDVNRPGADISKLVGGVIGGSLIQGMFKIGDEIEIMPGFQVTKGRKTIWEPIYTTVRTLVASRKMVNSVKPGGLIAIGTGLDPALTKADGLTGRVAGTPGTLPDIIDEISIDVNLLENVVGHTTEIKVENIRTNEALMISVGTATTVGIVKSARTNVADISLKNPIVFEKGQRISISRKITNRWRLIGYGIIR